MKHKKIAFTLIEIMIVLGMVGMIIIFAMQILMGRINQYTTPYAVIFRALQKTSYNILADIHCPNPNSEIEECKTSTRSFPVNDEARGIEDQHVELCERLKEYLNAPDLNAGECDNPAVGDNGDLKIVQNGSDITSDPLLKFVTSNGMKFYTSDMMTYEVVKTEDKNGDGDFNDPGEKITDEVKYYIIYVDINGDSKPNSVEPVGDYLPDIVPFAITSRGETIPLGFPTISSAYLTAKIKFPAVGTEEAGVFDERQYSKSMTFREAVFGAWNGEAHFDIPYSFDLNYNNTSNNRAFRSLPSADKKWENCKFYGGTNQYDATRGGCVAGTFTCRVIIDTETTRRF